MTERKRTIDSKTSPMPGRGRRATFIPIRDMAHGTSKVVEAVRKSGRPAILTNNGVPVAAVLALDDRAVATLTDYVLMNAPEFVNAMEQMDAALASDQRLEVVTEELLPDSADLPTKVAVSA